MWPLLWLVRCHESQSRTEARLSLWCARNQKGGNIACRNNLALRVETVDDAVVKTIGGDVLRADVIMAVVDGVLRELSPDGRGQEIQRLRAELKHVEKAVTNLTRAIAESDGELQSLLADLRTRQSRRDELVAIIAAHERVEVQTDRDAIENQVRQYVENWRDLLTGHVQDGRQLLKTILAEPLFLTPEGGTYRFEGKLAVGKFVRGIVPVAPFGSSPTGSVRCWGPDFLRIVRAA
jgi:hypothetical protein